MFCGYASGVAIDKGLDLMMVRIHARKAQDPMIRIGSRSGSADGLEHAMLALRVHGCLPVCRKAVRADHGTRRDAVSQAVGDLAAAAHHVFDAGAASINSRQDWHLFA